MNIPTQPPTQSGRRYGWWILLGATLLLSPFLIAGVAAYSLLTLDRDAAVLRREVMSASNRKWDTKVQLSVGWAVLGAVRTGLRFVHAEHVAEARLALAAVRQASVGVYECGSRDKSESSTQLFARTDQKMQARGWTRLVGVREHNETVLIYTADDPVTDDRMRFCVAVLEGNNLVVVSTKIEPSALLDLVEQHAPQGELRRKLKLAKFGPT